LGLGLGLGLGLELGLELGLGLVKRATVSFQPLFFLFLVKIRKGMPHQRRDKTTRQDPSLTSCLVLSLSCVALGFVL
jgi:hypothetical protein